ncbi:MAG TPA: Ku protein [Nocardioidaceae bacterium]|nr:Ku protein [Nocardioidaceae bacterium]
MRSLWKGAISFGLVSIPIQLYAATENKNVQLRQVHAADGGRIKYKRTCSIDGEEVPYSDIAKGYEAGDGQMVVLTEEDMSELPLPSVQGIEVLEFVPLEAIDPIQYDRTYYVEPQQAAVRPYVLLRDALQKSGQVAIAKVALRQRESLALLRVRDEVVVLTTLLWPDEVRVPAFGFLDEEPPELRSQEMDMAGALIDSMAEPEFDPDAYTDSYREALESVIEAKLTGQEIVAEPAASGEQADVIDLMSALDASISARKGAKKTASGKGEDKAPAKKTAKKTAAKKTTAKKTAKKTAAKKTTKATESKARKRKSA